MTAPPTPTPRRRLRRRGRRHGGNGHRRRLRRGRIGIDVVARSGESHDRHPLGRLGHEPVPDRGRDRSAVHLRDAGDVAHRPGSIGIAHPDTRHELGHVAAEPRIRRVLGGSRLAGGGAIAQAGGRPRPVIDDALQDPCRRVGVLRGQDLAAHAGEPAERPLEDLPVGTGDPVDRRRLHVGASRGERGVGRRHLQRRDLRRSETDRAHGGQPGSDTHPVGDLGDGLGPHLDRELREDRVHRAGRRVLDRHRPGGLVARVRQTPWLPVRLAERIRDRDRRGTGPDLERRDPTLQGRDEDERLERASRLSPGLRGEVELAPREAPAAHHRADRTVPRIDRDERRLWVGPGGEGGADRALGGSLPLHVEGGSNAQPASVEGVQSVAGLQVQSHVLHEVRRRRAHARFLGEAEGPSPQQLSTRGTDRPDVRHPRQGEVTSEAGLLRVLERIARRRCRDQAGERRRLQEREVLRITIEVRASRSLDAVRTVSEVDGVQIPTQDLVLGGRVLELDGEDRLPHLARHRSLRPRQHVLHVLLRDRRTTLAQRPAGEVPPRRAYQGHLVDTVVPVEIRVLDRHHGLAQRLRHLRERDQDPVDARVQLRDLVAVAIEEDRRLREWRDLGERRRRVQGDERPRGGDQREEDREDRDPGDQAPSAHREGRRGRDPDVTTRGARSDGAGRGGAGGTHGGRKELPR